MVVGDENADGLHLRLLRALFHRSIVLPIFEAAGQARAHTGTTGGQGLYLARTAEFGGPFAHRGEPDTRAVILRDALSVVSHLHTKHPGRFVEHEVYLAVARTGVTHDVVHRFEDDTVGGHLDGRGQGRQPLRGVYRDPQSAVLLVGRLRAQRPEEAERIEGGRT